MSGKPCKRGHVARRVRGYCVECRKLNHSEYQRNRLANDPEFRRRHNAASLATMKKPEQLAGKRRRRTERRVKAAGRDRPDVCEVCQRGGKIAFDHCHRTGKFRGWLCASCNLTVGRMQESPELLRRLANYVEEHNRKHPQADWVGALETMHMMEKQ